MSNANKAAPFTIIDPIGVGELAIAAQPGAPIDESSRKLLDQELKTLECRRTLHNLELPCAERDSNGQILRTDLTGIALSGGGIRSATFCLGVLQALAKADLLQRFDYLSTVSGGGYIGASLTWWLSGRWRPNKDLERDHAPQQSTQAKIRDLAEAPAATFVAQQPWNFGLDENSFPYGVGGAPNTPPVGDIKEVKRPKDAGPHLLNYLRKHGNYLTPGGGVNILSGISVGIRAVVLNLFVWIPLVTLAFLLLYWLPRLLFPYSASRINGELICSAETSGVGCIGDVLSHDVRFLGKSLTTGSLNAVAAPLTVVFLDAAAIALIFTVFALLYHRVTKLRDRRMRLGVRDGVWRWLGQRRWLPIIGVLSVAVLLHDPPALPTGFQKYWLIILVSILAMTYGLLCLVYSFGTWVVSKWKRGHDLGYTVRRLFESWAGIYLSVMLGLAVIGAVPLAADWLQASPEQRQVVGAAQATRPATPDRRVAATEEVQAQGASAAIEPAPAGVGGGVLALLAGLAATIAAFVRSSKKVDKSLRDRGFQVPGGATATLAAALLLFGVLLLSYQATVAILGGEISPLVALLVLAIAVASGFFVSINNISLGRFYRDRLLEAFMPGYEAALEERTDAAPQAAERMRLPEASSAAPYHIINTNVVLVRAKSRRRRIRGGDSFILTRDYCGSNATGWRKTDEFMDGKMTVPTAMAISGAAANPNTGVGGVGLARSKVVSALMTLVNLRLGYWAPHPTRHDLKQNVIPNHFRPGLTSFVTGSTEDCQFQELTDGGHFENLGIYELIRRRLRLILVCDAGQDAGFQFQDLQVALRRIEEDFGARIEFYTKSNQSTSDEAPPTYSIEDLMPEEAQHTYPRKLEIATRSFAVADVYYASDLDEHGRPRDGVDPARIIYLKATIIDQLPLILRGYKAREPTFPDQSTRDQFFDEDQFEAYRDLGQRLADHMIKGLCTDLDSRLPKHL